MRQINGDDDTSERQMRQAQCWAHYQIWWKVVTRRLPSCFWQLRKDRPSKPCVIQTCAHQTSKHFAFSFSTNWHFKSCPFGNDLFCPHEGLSRNGRPQLTKEGKCLTRVGPSILVRCARHTIVRGSKSQQRWKLLWQAAIRRAAMLTAASVSGFRASHEIYCNLCSVKPVCLAVPTQASLQGHLQIHSVFMFSNVIKNTEGTAAWLHWSTNCEPNSNISPVKLDKWGMSQNTLHFVPLSFAPVPLFPCQCRGGRKETLTARQSMRHKNLEWLDFSSIYCSLHGFSFFLSQRCQKGQLDQFWTQQSNGTWDITQVVHSWLRCNISKGKAETA